MSDYIQPPLQPLTQRFIDAASVGDVAALQILFSQLSTISGPLSVNGNDDPLYYPLIFALHAAIENNQPRAVSFLLDHYHPIRRPDVEKAIKVQSEEIFQVFLDHGWDINEPLGGNEPPALS